MWIDINTRIGHWPFKKLQFQTLDLLLKRMDEYGIAKSIVGQFNGIFYKNCHSANEELWMEYKSNPKFAHRFLPFGVINPTYPNWEKDLDICDSKWGMKGIFVYPKYHDYELDHSHLIELVRQARDRNMVVALTMRMMDNRQNSWLDVDQAWSLQDVMPLIRAVPDAKYFILNLANSPNLSQVDLDMLKFGQVIIDTSGRTMNQLDILIQKIGVNHFAFGSHAPILDYCSGRLRIEFLDEICSKEDMLLALTSGNARRILNI